MEDRDLIIIGGGPAGYVAAIRTRQLGGRVTLVEEDTVGGTCLNRGCIPMRALVRGVEFLEIPRKARDYGVNLGAAEVDFAKMMARKDTVVRTVTGGVKLLLEGNGAEVISGKGRLASPSEVEVVSSDGSTSRITARKILIATGARAKRPAVPGGDGVLTTDQAMELTEIPRSLLIIGGGSIGLAFATIFAKLGAEVTVAETSARILHDVDGEIVSILARDLRKQKVQILTEASITEIRDAEGGEKSVVVTAGGEEKTLIVQYVLAADEREANLEGLGLDVAGISTGSGGIEVNRRMETNVAGVLAAGDVVGEPRLAHVAFSEGRVAAENVMDKASEMDYLVVPRCINTFPEIASVGLTEEEAASQGYQTRIGRFPLAAVGMATILAERSGAVKIISEAEYGQILGIHIIGPHAAELIGEATLAMKMEATPKEISATIHTHPTISEALMEAALDVTGEALHSLSQDE
ncbi:MAG: dihydrolipoyl dehydrogenase [Dehalococcoidia bacterium]|nr:dihydrolipoyl dehydrogenase [Dehalococcoidia bacterium]MBL7165513.1 dihydrolipoyl dehydrogenase [Dehalococcoidales bacterium]